MLPPFAPGKLPVCLNGFAEGLGPFGFLFHRFSEDTTVECRRGVEAKDAKHRWRDVDICARQSGRDPLTKIWASRNEGVVHVEFAESGVAAFAGLARVVGNDLSRSAETVWLRVPAQCDHH